MKAQMYFDSKNVGGGGGGVCRTNASGITSSLSIDTIGGDNDSCSSSREHEGQHKKCKRVRRMRRRGQKDQKRRNHLGNREVKGEMIKEYLCKLQQIVPFSRKDKRLSKLEVITNAIDYIRELRETLGMAPCISSFGSCQNSSIDFVDTRQLPSLSPSLYSSNCQQFDHSSATIQPSSSSVPIISSGNSGSSPDNSLQSDDTVILDDSWGTLRPALWTISVPRNHDNDSITSSMISSQLSSDIVSS